MSLPPGEPNQLEPGKAVLDRELVTLAQAGEASAFEQLFTRYYQQISLYLIRMMGNEGIGYELTQEAFLKAWQALPELQNEAHFVGWLYRIATNLARDQQRRFRLIHWLPWDWQASREPISQDDPEKHLEESELLQAALAGVSLKYRACLILYIVEELPQKDIAERLGMKASYVSNYVQRGLTELRRRYTHLAGEQDAERKESVE